MNPVAAERLPLFEEPRRAPRGPPPWASERFQEPFVTAPLARAWDPPTSHTAAIAALPSAREQGKHITSCLKGLGPLREDGTGGGTAFEIALALNEGDPDGPWTSVIVSRRISGLRLNYVYSFDGDREAGRLECLRQHPGHRPMAVHVAAAYGGRLYPALERVA